MADCQCIDGYHGNLSLAIPCKGIYIYIIQTLTNLLLRNKTKTMTEAHGSTFVYVQAWSILSMYMYPHDNKELLERKY